MPFQFLCQLFEEIYAKKGPKKLQVFDTFVQKYCAPGTHPELTINFFPIVRMVLPYLDKERKSYNIKEFQLSRYLAEAFALPKADEDRLKHYKDPQYQIRPDLAGDFAGIAHAILAQDRCKSEAKLKVHEVNCYLDHIAEASDNKKLVFAKLCSEVTALEMKYICKLILKEMRLNIKHDTIFKNFNKNSTAIFNASNDLRAAIEKPLFERFEKDDKNKEKGALSMYKLLQPMRPMLASRKTYEQINKLFADKLYTIETKYDGERIQVHLKGDEVRMFSRNGNDTTAIYSAFLEQYIKENVKAECAILDGEIIVYDRSIDKFVPFGNNKAVALQSNDENRDDNRHLCIKLFDLMYVKNNDTEIWFLDQPLEVRRKVLYKLVDPVENILDFTYHLETRNILDVYEELDKAIKRSEEGIIIKQLETTYKCGVRDESWVKLKVDLYEGLADTMDLIVVGGYLGQGDWQVGGNDAEDHITGYLLAIVNKEQQDFSQTTFIPFCRITGGVNMESYSVIRTRMRGNWIRHNLHGSSGKESYQHPKLASWRPSAAHRPDFWVNDLSKSLVMEIKAYEILPTDGWPYNYTLRFARMVKLRLDKSFSGVLDTENLNVLIDNFNKGVVRERREDRDVVKVKKVFRRVKGDFIDHFKFNQSGIKVEVVAHCFEGLVFAVMLSNPQEKLQVENHIRTLGGTVYANAVLNQTHYVVANSKSFAVKTVIAKMEGVSVVRSAWVDTCLASRALVHLSSFYLLHASEALRAQMQLSCDQFGDAYQYQTDEFILNHTLADMDQNVTYQQRLMDVFDLVPLFIERQNPKVKLGKPFSLEHDAWGYERLNISHPDFCRIESMLSYKMFADKVFYIFYDNSINAIEDFEFHYNLLERMIDTRGGSVIKVLNKNVDVFVYFEALIQKADLEMFDQNENLVLKSDKEILELIKREVDVKQEVNQEHNQELKK